MTTGISRARSAGFVDLINEMSLGAADFSLASTGCMGLFLFGDAEFYRGRQTSTFILP